MSDFNFHHTSQFGLDVVGEGADCERVNGFHSVIKSLVTNSVISNSIFAIHISIAIYSLVWFLSAFNLDFCC